MRVRVVHIIRGEPFQGGADIYVTTLLAHLDRERFDPSVLVLAKAPAREIPLCARLAEAAIDHEVLEAPAKLHPAYFSWTLDRLKAAGATLVHTHEYKSALIGLYTARRAGAAAVGTAHGWTASSTKARIYEAIERRLLKRFDGVIACSEFMRRDLVDLGIAPERIPVIYSASELPPPGDGPEFRRAAGIGEEAFLVGTLGRLSREKGQAVLLEALREVRAHVPGIAVVLAGEGPDRPALEAAVPHLGLSGAVTFMPSLPRPRLGSFFEAIDIFVLPSLRENLPLALIEAMQAGRPIVAAAVGGVPELIEDRKTGLLVPPGDPGALARAIRELAGDETLRRRLASEARRQAVQRFTGERFAEQMGEFYGEMLAKQDAR